MGYEIIGNVYDNTWQLAVVEDRGDEKIDTWSKFNLTKKKCSLIGLQQVHKLSGFRRNI